jgi:hypothetical protein
MITFTRVLPAFMLTLLCGFLGFNSLAQGNAGAGEANVKIVDAAKTFLATRDETQRGKVIYSFKDDSQRRRWSNFPTFFVKRGGLRLGDFSQPQRSRHDAPG